MPSQNDNQERGDASVTSPTPGESTNDPYTRPGATAPVDAIPDEADFDGEPHEDGPTEMGFFDHLEELRSRIIKALVALVACAILCGVFVNFIMEEILLRPAIELGIKLQNIEVMGQLTLAIQVCLFSGLILSIPFVLWQLWAFIQPGLYRKERKYATVVGVATIFCFLLGVSFAYFVMVPASLGFAAKFRFGPIENEFNVGSYFSFVLGFVLACGAIFEMPMLSYALSRFGILTPQLMRKYRRHAIVVLLIVAAIITPTPDPVNQILLAAPLYALYEISIIVARTAGRQRTEALEEAGLTQ